MIDGIIKADGTSRLMRAKLPATYEEFKAQASAGTLPIDVLFNSTGWSQMPTFLNKVNLLTDEIASVFGMDVSAVPNDVFAFLGKYNQHWWSVLHGQAGSGYREKRTLPYTSSNDNSTSITAHESHSQTLSCSKTIAIDQSTGAVSLVNPQSVVMRGGNTAAAVKTYIDKILAMAPVYITNLYGNPSTIYYIPADATWTEWFYNASTETFGASRTGDGYMPTLNTMASCTKPPYVVTSQVYNIPAGETTYVHSTDRNAYPDSGTVDGLTYQYLGIPFQNAVTAPKIATGSYTGTGTYGSSNPNSLTFEFEPKLVIVFMKNDSGNYYDLPRFHYGTDANHSAANYFMWVSNIKKIAGGSSVGRAYLHFTLSDKTLSWYCEEYDVAAAGAQLNRSSFAYHYIAIG